MTKRPLGRTASYRAAVYNVLLRGRPAQSREVWCWMRARWSPIQYALLYRVPWLGNAFQMFVTVISSSIASQKNWDQRLSANYVTVDAVDGLVTAAA